MDESKKRAEPKKIRLTPLVDRSSEYDTLSFDGDTLPESKQTYEDYLKNNSQSIPKLESNKPN